jgi:hypothetical protein
MPGGPQLNMLRDDAVFTAGHLRRRHRTRPLNILTKAAKPESITDGRA